MDPNAAWREIQSAIRDNDYLRAEILLEDLNAWVNTGGFLPEGVTKKRLAAMGLVLDLLGAMGN